LEYGYQQQQFCKMPRFCIPVLLNESSLPFSWADLLQVRNGRVNCRVRERGRACSWIWAFIRIRRIGWFVGIWWLLWRFVSAIHFGALGREGKRHTCWCPAWGKRVNFSGLLCS
jgi:hypothetical protein